MALEGYRLKFIAKILHYTFWSKKHPQEYLLYNTNYYYGFH